MLDKLRKGAQGWVAKLLLILLVAAFGVWGISGSMFDTIGNSVVTVGDTTVSPTEYRLAYNRQLGQLGQQLGTRLTSEQARAFGVPQRALSQLVAGAALDEQASEMNLGLSDDRLARLIAEDPAFHDFNGEFDRANFARVLGALGMSQADYIESRSKVAVRSQIVEAVADGFKAPDAMLAAMAQHQAETRDVDYILLTADALPPVADPGEEELQAYYDAHKADYVAPEYRKITYVKLEPEDIADPAAISREAVQADYEANKAKYSTPETRTVDQLVFDDRAAAEEAAERLAGELTFDELAAELGRNPADIRIGSFAEGEAPSAAIGEAVFAVEEEGGTTGVVDGPFGPIILRVAEITPERTRSLEEVGPEIRRQMALSEAYDMVLTVHDAFEDALAGGATLTEAADQQRLDVATVEAVDRSGRNPAGEVLSDLPQSQELLQSAFEADAGVQLPPIAIGSDGFVWYHVDEVMPERQKAFDEVREQVIADYKAQEADKAVGAKATEIVERLNNGDTLATIAGELGLSVETKYALQRDSEDPVFGPAAVEAAFGGPQGHAGVAPADSSAGRIVFKVTAVNDASQTTAESVPESQRQAISRGMADDILDQMVSVLRNQYGVEVNQTLAERAIAF